MLFVPLTHSSRRLLAGGARVYENQSIRADRGQAARLLSEIIERSKRGKPSKLFVRAESDNTFVSAVGTLTAGDKSFGGFFAKYAK